MLTWEYSNEVERNEKWLLEVDNTIQEVLYEENSGGPFVYDLKKFKSDLYKLFQLGHDSKQKMGVQLINNNLHFLLDYEFLYEQLCAVELFLVQAYGIVSFFFI